MGTKDDSENLCSFLVSTGRVLSGKHKNVPLGTSSLENKWVTLKLRLLGKSKENKCLE